MPASMEPQTAPPPEALRSPSSSEIAAWVLTAFGLFLVLRLHLLAALVGGLAVYEVVHILARRLRFIRTGGRETRKVVAVTLLAAFVVAALTFAILGLIAFFRSDLGNLSALIQKMADILDSSKENLPVWLAEELPTNADELRVDLVTWLRDHAGELQTLGAEVGRSFVHALIGMIIGAMLAFNETRQVTHRAPLAARVSLPGQTMHPPVLTIEEQHNIENGAWFSKLSEALRSDIDRRCIGRFKHDRGKLTFCGHLGSDARAEGLAVEHDAVVGAAFDHTGQPQRWPSSARMRSSSASCSA